MKILLYNRLNTEPVQRQFDKTLNYLQQGDFRSADVRKMKTQGFYRARLDDTNRLLFKIGEFEGEKYLFILEVILNHDYDKSRFLRGAAVQEDKLKPIYGLHVVPDDDVEAISYINPGSRRFSILDKFITFNENQYDILQHEPPLLLLGAAGCGKTVLALEKMRQVKGKVLYVSLSAPLVQKAKEVYFTNQEAIPEQMAVFCTLDQFLRLYLDPKNARECEYQDFKEWFERIKPTVKIKDTHKLFEEIRGVLTGTSIERGYYTPEEYERLGVRQSIFPTADRMEVYGIFSRYVAWLKSADLYDPNMFAFFCMDHVRPQFNLVVVDEVQDMTNMQLAVVLKSLECTNQFILCGDANQVVHPNFFSWTSVKRLLHQRNLSREIVRLLPGNHRNDEKIIQLSNRILALKNVRFGSIDRESSHLVFPQTSAEPEVNTVQFYEGNSGLLQEMNGLASISSDMAILVLREADKAEAKKHFNTPMIFTVHEAKGLEFRFVVLFNFISNNSEIFASICEGVAPRDLNGDLVYNRPKDKEDRSLQAYLFYINSLYVAMTRALDFLYVIERDTKHRLLSLLGVRHLKKRLGDQTYRPLSTLADWQREAERLEKFGKKEQADAIKAKIGNIVPTPWAVLTYQEYIDIRDKLLFLMSDNMAGKIAKPSFNNREKRKIYDHLLFYTDMLGLTVLFSQSKTQAFLFLQDASTYMKKLLMPYQADNPQRIEPLIRKYGPDFRNEIGLTPLMLATMAGAPNIAKYLLMAGADPNATDNWGRCPFQLAMAKAYKDEKYAKEKFREIMDIVQPPYLYFRESTHYFSMPQGTMHYYITAIILALQRDFFYEKRREEHTAFRAEDIVKVMQHLATDEQTAKKYRKEAIAAYMAKSDIALRKNPFLMRLRKGYYTLRLSYEIKICNEWVALSDLFEIDQMKIFEGECGVNAFYTDIINWAFEMRAKVDDMVEQELIKEDEAFEATLPDEDLRDWPV